MAGFSMEVNTRAFSKTDGIFQVKISSVANNGLSFNGDKIKATKGKTGADGIGINNSAGDGIVEDADSSFVRVIKCTSAVSRIQVGTDTENEGVYLPDIITSLKNNPIV